MDAIPHIAERPESRVFAVEAMKRERGGIPLQRYDQNAARLFDVDKRENLSHEYGAYAHRAGLDTHAANILEGIALANINLRSRKLVGLVLGSTVQMLTYPPEDLRELESHRDLDVLILQEHSPRNPSPNEWGIDWFVRPEGRMDRAMFAGEYEKPTNGRIGLWYDITLKEGVRVSPERSIRDTIVLDAEKGIVEVFDAITHDPHGDPKFIVQNTIAPGLYIPDERTVGQIVEHSNAKASDLRSDFDEVFSEIRRDISALEKSADSTPGEIFDQGKAIEAVIGCLCSDIGVRTGYLPIEGLFVDANVWKIQESVICFLRGMTNDVEEKCRKVVREDYEYLRLQGVSEKNPLLPVLSHTLLSFRGL